MKAQKLIAGAAAVLLTFASLNAVDYNVEVSQPGNLSGATTRVTELPGVRVSPSAAERRAAALLNDVATVGLATGPSLSPMQGNSRAEQLGLLGSQLAMPYYSFGNKFGRISKE
ncbi:MAG: hypothetical protein KGM46_07010 [Pseudomonadota bacterium]|jgi:hypothetical protein|nr:hypothetical protein [Pseudomonadota bacterium]